MNEMFNEAVEWSHRNVLRCLELMFMRCTHKFSPTELHNLRKTVSDDAPMNKDYYVNMHTSICQWTCPYHPRAFHSQDIEIGAFVAIAMQYDVLPTRCVAALLQIL